MLENDERKEILRRYTARTERTFSFTFPLLVEEPILDLPTRDVEERVDNRLFNELKVTSIGHPVVYGRDLTITLSDENATVDGKLMTDEQVIDRFISILAEEWRNGGEDDDEDDDE